MTEGTINSPLLNELSRAFSDERPRFAMEAIPVYKEGKKTT